LLARYPGEKWIHLTRKWTMISLVLSEPWGILLGAHWAYAVLGWGGYWGWDPVRMRRCCRADRHRILHSVMMQEKRGMMKVWHVWLV